MRIRFNLRDQKRKVAPIYMIYNVNGERLVFPTKEKIPVEHWSVEYMRAKRSLGEEEADKINSKLRLLERVVYNIEAEFNTKDKMLTKASLRKCLNREIKTRIIGKDPENIDYRDNNKKCADFANYINDFILRREADSGFAEGTIKVYRTFQKHWRRYCRKKHDGCRFEFDELTLPILEGFKFYLTNHKSNYSDNQIDKMIRTGKVILNDATERGLNKNMDYKSKVFSHSSKPGDNIYLSNAELEKILELDLSDHPQMALHRDLFIIGSYTGLRYSDFCRINKSNIITVTDKKDKPFRVIKTFMQKVNRYVYIPIHPTVERLLKYHDYDLGKYTVANAVINRHLKIIGEMAEIDDDVTKVVYRSTKGVKTHHKKYELITTHTARRSFATNAYKAGVPMLNIMRITGHKTSSSFLKYISFDDEENAVLMAEHEFFGC